MSIDLAAIKARLSAITLGDWYQGTYPDGDDDDGPTGEYLPGSDILCEGEQVVRAGCAADAAFIAHAPGDIAVLVAEVEALRVEVARLRALVPAPPKTPPPGEVWRHDGTLYIDGTDYNVDFLMVGKHRIDAYYPSSNEWLRDRCGYSPYPTIWVDGAIYWEGNSHLVAEEEEYRCAEIVEALIRYILERGEMPSDFGDLRLDDGGEAAGG